MNIVKLLDLPDILKQFQSKNELILFGKGPSFRTGVQTKSNQMIMCVNDSINHINNCDILVINDLKNMFKIETGKLKNLKNLIIPYHIHQRNFKPDINYTYHNFCQTFNEKYQGNLIVYNLRTINVNYSDFVSLDTAISGAHTGLEFIFKFLPSIRTVSTYGIGKKNGYHPLFVPTVTKEHLKTKCSQARTNMFKNWAIALCNKFKVQLVLN